MSYKIVLFGAGSKMFALGTLGDIFRSNALRGSDIVLCDINKHRLHSNLTAAQEYIDERRLPFTVSATVSAGEAVREANFCIIAIEVGDRFKLWEQDWMIPLQYGFRQIFGENGGPGGLFHSLRIIPQVLTICEQINTIAPEAYVINLSNPLTRISHAVNRKYPDLNYVGLCDLIGSPIEHLPLLLNTSIDNLSLTAGGFNHFSIITDITYRSSGKDAYPDVRTKGRAYFEKAPAYFKNIGERALFLDILDIYGYLPMTTDSHIGEYLQWAHSTVNHSSIINFYAMYKNYVFNGSDSVPAHVRLKTGSGKEHWRAIPIIEGITSDSNQEEIAVNIPNRNYIHGIPASQIVEVPATINRTGIHGMALDPYPTGFLGMLMNQVAVNELTTEAVLTADKNVVLQALLADPIVDNLGAAKKMLDLVLSVQGEYLGYIK